MDVFCPMGRTSFDRADIARREGPRTLPFILPHALHHPLDMCDRRLRLDAVAEIEDQPALAVIREYIVDRAVEGGATRDQNQRIEISLHRDAVLHALPDEGGIGGPVDADGIDR